MKRIIVGVLCLAWLYLIFIPEPNIKHITLIACVAFSLEFIVLILDLKEKL